MSDIEAPIPYSKPVADRQARDGSTGLVVLLALTLACAAVGLAMVSRELAEPFVLALLAGLAVIGVFCLFAGAIGILRFGERQVRNDLTKSFADNLPDGALFTDGLGRIAYANAAYRRLMRLSPDEPVFSVEQALGTRPHLNEAVTRLVRAAGQAEPNSEDLRLDVDPGDESSATWLRVSVAPMPAGPFARRNRRLTVWQVRDISGERRREEGAFEKMQQAIAYLDNAPAGFVSVNAEGAIDFLNATLARWLGIDLTELKPGTLKLTDILSEGGAALMRSGHGDPKNGAPRLDIDLQRSDGTSLPVRILHSGVAGAGRGSAGANLLAHALVLNRSPGEAEEAPAAELRFARFFHSAPIAIATVDRDGAIGSTNAAFAGLFGLQSAAGKDGATPLLGLFNAEVRESVTQAIAKAGAGRGEGEAIDVTFEGQPNRSGRLYISPSQQPENEREAAIIYAIDTTAERALEVQIAQSQKMQAVGQLAGGIAHDFNNVLTAIIGFSDFLLQNHRATDPGFQDIMNIKHNANRAAGLVRQLLAFSRQQTLRPQVLNLADVLNDLLILLGRLLGENITLDVDHGRDLWRVKADLHQFEQVIINLAVNARDAMTKGGKLTVRTFNMSEDEIRASGRRGVAPSEYVVCEISDTGCGMTPEIMEKIFEPFFSTKDVGKGTGLGLSTVYGIVKQTGGFIFPESEPGRGTTFRVYLPRHIEVAAEATVKPVKAKPKDLTGTGTVLLVEDEDAVRNFAARALQQRGYQVLQASTGAEALEVMRAHSGKVDLVLSDVVMPEMDGPTMLKHLKVSHPDLRIVFISGYAEDAFRKNLDVNEEFIFLQKPFDLKTLAETVKNALAA